MDKQREKLRKAVESVISCAAAYSNFKRQSKREETK